MASASASAAAVTSSAAVASASASASAATTAAATAPRRRRRGEGFEILSHFVGEGAEMEDGEEVDCKHGFVAGGFGEEGFDVWLDVVFGEPLFELLHAELLLHFLEQELDEDARGRGSVFLRNVHRFEHVP